jgi:integrase
VFDPRAHILFQENRIATAAKLSGPLNRFTSYLTSLNLIWESLLPIQQHTVLINYLTHLRHSVSPTRGAISDAVRAISFHHRSKLSIDYPDPTKSSVVADYLAAIEKSFPDTPVHRRLPLTKANTASLTLLAHDWATTGRPHFFRMYVLIPLAYKAASRIGEILSLRRKHIIISTSDPQHFVLDFPKRKCKKRREQSLSYVSKDPDSSVCPYETMISYLRQLGILHPRSFSPEDIQQWEESFLFPGGLVYRSTGLPTGSITYHAVYDQLKALCSHKGLDVSDFGWHSTRSAAITDSLHAGFTQEQVASHSGHADVRSLSIYNQGTITSKLSISKKALYL